MPILDGYIFLGYDPDTGNPTFYPSLPDPTAAWYASTDSEDGPDILSPTTGQVGPSVYVPDANGDFNYLVPELDTAELSFESIALVQSIYEWCEAAVVAAGYQALNGDTFLTVGDDQFRLALAQHVPTGRYDLIAFQTTPQTVDGGMTFIYTASMAIVIGTGFEVQSTVFSKVPDSEGSFVGNTATVIYDLSPDALPFPEGGYEITGPNVGLRSIIAVIFIGGIAADLGYIPMWDSATGKFTVFLSSTGIEPTGDQSALSFRAMFIGDE